MDMAVRMQEIEVKARTSPVATIVSPSFNIGFSVSKNTPLVLVFRWRKRHISANIFLQCKLNSKAQGSLCLPLHCG